MNLFSYFKIMLLTVISTISASFLTYLQAEPVHGYSLYGDLKYPADFTHYDYANPDAPKGGTLKLATLGTFDSLNPFVIKGTPAAGLTLLYPSYLHATLGSHAADELLSEYGYIAESFELDSDHRWLICHIRDNAQFHDGSPIRTSDIIYSFNVLTTQGNPLYRNYYKDVQSVEKIDDVTVKFVFTNTENRELPMIIADMPILSEKYWHQTDFNKADLSVPVGSGPYKIIEVKPGHSIVYERVKDWWGENIPVNKGLYNFDRIRFDYYRDDAVMFEAFKSGTIDLRMETKAQNWATAYDFPLVKQGHIIKDELQFEQSSPAIGFIFNTRRDIFKNLAIRHAISLCYDFEWLNKNLFYGAYQRIDSYFGGSALAASGLPSAGELAIISSLQLPVDTNVVNREFKLPVTDGSGSIRAQLAAAKRILEDAGYKFHQGQLIDPRTLHPIKFKILLPDAMPDRSIQNFVKNMAKIGIDAIIQVTDAAQYTLRVSKFDYDMIYGGVPQSLIPGNEQREFWHSDSAQAEGSFNFAGVHDPAIDAVIEKLIQTSDRQTVVTMTKILDRLLLWGYYMVPSYYNKAKPIAYNYKLKHPAQLPRYSFDLNTWWFDDGKGVL